jgi:hypothetical protein
LKELGPKNLNLILAQSSHTGNDNTKRGRGGSKKEKKLESYFSTETTRSCGERCLNTDTTDHRKAPAALLPDGAPRREATGRRW